jgi:hypothetical protein
MRERHGTLNSLHTVSISVCVCGLLHRDEEKESGVELDDEGMRWVDSGQVTSFSAVGTEIEI